MNNRKWSAITIPIMALLILSQLITGLMRDHISDGTFGIVHIGGGILLVILVAAHLFTNRTWLRSTYVGKK